MKPEELWMRMALAAGFGLAATLLAWAVRPRLMRRFHKDCRRVRAIAFRFTPEPVNAARWVLMLYGSSLALLGVLLALAPHPLFAVMLWLAAMPAPYFLVEYAWHKRRKKIEIQLPEAISSMANCVHSGLTLVQAIERLGESAPEPVRTEFRIMHNRYSYGLDLEKTILEAKSRLALQNFNLFATALLVNRRMGGDIARTLERIAVSMVKLEQMRRTIEVHTSEGRMNIKVLMAAPVLMLGLLASVDSAGVSLLFSTPQGWCVLVVAGLLTGGGLFWATKIVHTEI